MFIRKHLLCLLSILFFFQFVAFGQNTSLHQNLDKKNIAVSGYDVVEYFNHKPVKGNAAFESVYNGSKYRFQNQKNKLLFDENPEQFTPQYGGWCAYAMGENGEKVSINPQSFSIENGKLYLFYKTFFNDTKAKWNEDTATLKTNADKNWKTVIKTQK